MLGDFSARVLPGEDNAAIVDLGDAIWPGDEDTHITQHIFLVILKKLPTSSMHSGYPFGEKIQ